MVSHRGPAPGRGRAALSSAGPVAALVILLTTVGLPHDAVPASGCMPTARDYGFLWWAEGPPAATCRFLEPEATAGRKEVLCIRTGRYGLALDTRELALSHAGTFAEETPASRAFLEENGTILALPTSAFAPRGFLLRSGDAWYRCVGRDPDPQDPVDYPVRIIECGRLFQRFDILGLRFASEEGKGLPVVGRLEVSSWPDLLSFQLEIEAEEDVPLEGAKYSGPGDARESVVLSTWLPPRLRRGVSTRALASAIFDLGPQEEGTSRAHVSAEDLRKGERREVRFDPQYGWHRLVLPSEGWRIEQDPDRLERYRLEIMNFTKEPRPVRLLFAKEGPFSGITGMSAILRDEGGNPTGIPVQISKNWHRKEGHPLVHEGPWFHGFAVVRMPPESETKLELTIAYARWGGVPAASHAQLSLVGWGHNQLWDEVAVGSWGESICYEPDAVQRRCRIDDIRPLLVWSMGRERTPWGWTNNVGGGDFLVYSDGAGRYRPLVRVRPRYESHGPNLTRVTYGGVTDDGRIAARMTVETPRADDLVRAFHRIRYDVRERTPFRRLAFYQVGADEYLWFPFGKIARGDLGGVVEEWTPELGGRRYSQSRIPCPGPAPWFSLHESVSQDAKGGAWANRGFIVRSWKARLGGRPADVPHVSIYGTESGIKSANLELSPPPALDALEAGDFLEAELELVVVPMAASDYYGPNEGLRRALEQGGNTWKPVFREARGNALDVRALRGRVLRRYPIEVEVDAKSEAEIEVSGGVGYVPVTFVGLRAATGYRLERIHESRASLVDQSVHGNDYWQTDFDAEARTWSRTYNLALDLPLDPGAETPSAPEGGTPPSLPVRLRLVANPP